MADAPDHGSSGGDEDTQDGRSLGTDGSTTATTVLFRAVGHAEFSDVMSCGALRPGPNSYATGKFFAESGDAAVAWGNVLEGPGHFRILEVGFSKPLADGFMRFNRLDGIGPARFGRIDQLGQATIKVWAGSP